MSFVFKNVYINGHIIPSKGSPGIPVTGFNLGIHFCMQLISDKRLNYPSQSTLRSVYLHNLLVVSRWSAKKQSEHIFLC